MFERIKKEVEFQDGKLVIGAMPVYRSICLREKFNRITKEEDGESKDGVIELKCEVIAECLLDPKKTIEELQQLDMVTIDALFDLVADHNGMHHPKDEDEDKPGNE